MSVNYHLPLLLLWVAPVASAQPLSSFLAAAERDNLDVREARINADHAAVQYAGSWGALTPSLSASGAWVNNQYSAVVAFPVGPNQTQQVTLIPKNQFDGALRVDLPVIDVAGWLRAAAAGARADAAGARATQTRDQVRREVISAYYGYAGALAVEQSARRSLALAEAQSTQQTVRAEVGTSMELELLRARAEVERNHQLVADAVENVANARRALWTLSGLAPGPTAELPEDALAEEPPVEDLERGVDGLPAIQAADADVVAAGRTANSAWTVLVPALNAQFTERFTNATGFQGQSVLYNAGLNLLWRLDLSTVQTIRDQGLAAQSADLAAQKARLLARDLIHSDWQRVVAARVKVRAAALQVEANRRAASIADERYRAGVATQTDVIQSQRDLFLAEVGDIQARFALASARASLKVSAGLALGNP